MTTKTASATACWPAGIPVWAIAAPAATASRRFFGLIPDSATPIASERPAVNVSIVFIQLGSSGFASPRGRPRQVRSATSSSSRPSTSFNQPTHDAGWP